MTPELEGYCDQLTSIRQDVPGIVRNLTDEQFNWREAPGRWSIAQCFEHLNITAASFIPAMNAAIDEARQRGLLGTGPFTYPFLERFMVRSQEPPPRRRFRAGRNFQPAPELKRDEVMTAFMEWQDRLEECLKRADGVDLQLARRRSPVLPIITWRLGTMFALTLAHERRHIWQARQVRKTAGW